MKITYCDDQIVHLKAFKENFSDIFAGDELCFCLSPEEIFTEISAGHIPDIIFMDIDFNSAKNGIDCAEEICRLAPSAKIIYVTAYTDKFVQDIFIKKSNVSGFLIKPLKKEYLLPMLENARNAAADCAPKIITVMRKNSVVAINEKDIVYIESDKHMIHIVTKQDIYDVYEKLSDFRKKLSDNFESCHKSFIVNMDNVKLLESDKVMLNDDRIIPVSRSKYPAFREKYLTFLKKSL